MIKKFLISALLIFMVFSGIELFGVYVALTVQDIVITGINVTDNDETPDAGGNYFANNGKVYLYALNASAGAITITFETPATVAGGVAIAEHAVEIPIAEEMIIGPFDMAIFNQSNGTVQLTTSAQASLTIMAFKVN